MSKTVDRIPLFSKFKAHIKPAIPPPIIATTGSLETGAENITCSWLNVFLRIDLLEVPYDGFLLLLEVDFGAFVVDLFLGLGLGMGCDELVSVRVLKEKQWDEDFGGLRARDTREEEEKEEMEADIVFGGRRKQKLEVEMIIWLLGKKARGNFLWNHRSICANQ